MLEVESENEAACILKFLPRVRPFGEERVGLHGWLAMSSEKTCCSIKERAIRNFRVQRPMVGLFQFRAFFTIEVSIKLSAKV